MKKLQIIITKKCLQVPSTESDCEQIAKKFEESWNFPNCIGAAYGKHVVMNAPHNSGSIF